MKPEPSSNDIWQRQAAELGVDHLEFAVRALRVLVNAGISLNQLLTLSRTDFLALRNLGEGCVRNIEARLADRGLS